jgi:hypothetical protein
MTQAQPSITIYKQPRDRIYYYIQKDYKKHTLDKGTWQIKGDNMQLLLSSPFTKFSFFLIVPTPPSQIA